MTCSFPQCENKAECYIDGSKYCTSHYRVWKNTGALRPLARRNRINCGFKKCFMCDRNLALSNFNMYNKELRYYYPACKECQPQYLKSKELKRRYKISHEEYLEISRGGCRICGSKNRLAVDHDHGCCPGEFTCGECVRGVLCSKHNHMLGMAGDSPEILFAAVQYLQTYESVKFFEDNPEMIPGII